MSLLIFNSAARTATTNSDPIEGAGGKGAWLVLDVTAASGTTPTLDVKLQRYDSVSSSWVDVPGAAFAQQTTTGTNELTVYPGVGETANVAVSDHLGSYYRAVATIGGTTPSFTFSLAGQVLA